MQHSFKELVKNKLFTVEEEIKVFTVKLSCRSTTSGEDEIVQEFSIRARTAEEAKNSALNMAKEAGYFDCKVDDVSMVVDPLDPSSANLGLGTSLGADKTANSGNRGPGAA